jgi:hypothetical protein
LLVLGLTGTPAQTTALKPFIFAWIAFNAWGECVSGQERDEDWVRSLSHDSALNRDFDQYLQAEPHRAAVECFRTYWPIPRVQAWRRHPDARPTGDGNLARAQFFRAKRIPCAPACALGHLVADEEIPLDWEHFIHAVYRVRCNLFHGEKSPYDTDDARIVHASFGSLVGFMDRLGCFA